MAQPAAITSLGTCTYTAPTETCTAPTLAAGQVWTVTLTVAVSAPSSTAYSDTATVTGTEGTTFTASATATATATPALPAGFAQTKLAGGLAKPIVLDFAPNGDLYIGEQGGTILVYRNGAVQPTPVLSLTVFEPGRDRPARHGPRPQLRHQRLPLHLLHRRSHHLRRDEPALRPPVPLHRGQRRGQPGQREDPLHRQPGPAHGRHRRQLRPRRQRPAGRPRRQALVERGGQRPLHQQRREPGQHLRQDPPLQPRRLRPGRQPLRQRVRSGALHLRLRAPQSVAVHLPPQRPGHDRGHRLQLLGGPRHHPGRGQLRLAVQGGRLRQLRLPQPGVRLRPLPDRRRRLGHRRLLGYHLPPGLQPRGLLRRLHPPRHRGGELRPQLQVPGSPTPSSTPTPGRSPT